MKMAEDFDLPLISFIDTPGAYPGIESEERGMSEAIAKNLSLLSNLKTPVIVIITGEGGSGGALAIGVGDHVCMLEHSIYAVASPEACASIVWRDGSKAKDAAEAMKVDASSLQNLGLVDQVIKEPLGGAHRDLRGVSNSISQVIEEKLLTFDEIDISDLLDKRYEKIMSYGSI
jgi:acetyl-CoA carboxylase carboxyl transferase subunit alpha